MKRSLTLLLVVLLTFSMMACAAQPSTQTSEDAQAEALDTASTEAPATVSAEVPGASDEPTDVSPSNLDMAGKRIFFINILRAYDFFVSIEESVTQAAKEYGFEVTCVDSNLDFAKASDYIAQAVLEGYDIIMISGDKSLITGADEAEAAGVPVVNYDSWIGSDNISALVASDNYEMGKQIGDYTVELLKQKKGDVSGLIYYISIPTSSANDRVSGFLSAFENYPNVELKEVISPAAEVNDSQAKIENVLTANPAGSLDVILGSNSSTALGAIAAAETANRKDVIIVGIDDEEGQMAGLQNPDSCYQATIAQDPQAIGRLCVEAAVKVLRGEAVDKIAVPTVLVTKENVQEYLATR